MAQFDMFDLIAKELKKLRRGQGNAEREEKGNECKGRSWNEDNWPTVTGGAVFDNGK